MRQYPLQSQAKLVSLPGPGSSGWRKEESIICRYKARNAASSSGFEPDP